MARTTDGSLVFKFTYPEDTKPMVKPDKRKRSATFSADVLGAESVHVLQLEMDRYVVNMSCRNGGSSSSSYEGYLFRRVSLGPDNGFRIHRLNLDVLGKVAEEDYAGSEFKIDVEAFTHCLSEDVVASFGMQAWGNIRSLLGEDALGDIQDALEMDQEERSEIEQEAAELAKLKVDPYAELAHIRNCVARRLPSEALEQVFLQHTDRVFSGGTDGYVPE